MARCKMYVEQVFNPDHAPGNGQAPHRYHVTKVVNSVTPSVGENLDRATIAAYCEREDWDVTVEKPR